MESEVDKDKSIAQLIERIETRREWLPHVIGDLDNRMLRSALLESVRDEQALTSVLSNLMDSHRTLSLRYLAHCCMNPYQLD